jgi:maltooligosyltrehalose trehalohydrolase
MARFSVWAPRAERVELVLGDDAGLAMERSDDRGWFTVDAGARPGDDYAYRLDGGDALPDPRSPWQPHGVNGPSRLVDHAAFHWTDAGWTGRDPAGAVVYELHVGTFSPAGTFDGAIACLPHLVDLGVDTVELLPVAQFPGRRGWGYDGVDLYAPHHDYGGPEGLKRLVDACHGAGLAVVLDVVYNHLGPAGNHLGRFGPYFTDRYATPWGEAVNFDGSHSDPVREFFVDNALMWLRDYHFDGLRLDAVHAYLDTSATHILEELAVRVGELAGAVGRRLFLIAESDLNDPRVVNDRSRGGYGVDAQWSDDFHHALHAALTGERGGYYEEFGSMATLAKSLRQAFVFDGCYSAFRHRRHGRRPEGLEAARFLGYLQNHDQIGNRATGERSSMLMSGDLLRVAAALVLCGPFVPMLFQGEEWAASTPFLYFTDHDDPELGRLVSEGRRREFASFGWKPDEVPDPQAEESFAASRLDWDEISRPPHTQVLDWHRRLIALRRDVPALSDGRFPDDVRFDEDGCWLVLDRGAVTIAANLGSSAADVPLCGGRAWSVLLASKDEVAVEDGIVRLPAASVAILG